MTETGNLYADLSGFYDLFCAEVNYAEQCAFTKRVFNGFSASGGQQYLDLACGTGAHIQIMQSLGFAATGLDNSAHMLEQAAIRCPEAKFILSDMSSFQGDDQYDLISCFLYSIHYSHPVSSLKRTLKRTFDALKPGGVFVFNTVDINGINNRHFVNTQVNTASSRLTFVSGWSYAGQGEVMDLHLSITQERADTHESADNTMPRVWRDRHTMTAINIEQLSTWLIETGYEVTLLEHDYNSLQAWSKNSFNIIVVASKPL
ncbi:MAG: class I SAM-dependent methyltransferase [Pseudohongiella sp.]|nr:class I SAM-dependent methyltransferase [Pseudohongiella sp.]